jgi:type VI secretion system protein ImpK
MPGGPQFEPTLEGLFREFHALIVQQKQLVRHPPSQPPPATVQTVWATLVKSLEEQATRARNLPGVAPEDYQQAQYLMAGFADEVFLNLDWPNPSDMNWWEENLMESRLFRTHVAGVRVFQRVDQLLEEGRNSRKDLARAYLLALGLGFLGKFRGASDLSGLHRVTRDLWVFARDQDSATSLVSVDDPPPPLALHVNSTGDGKRSPLLRRWLIAAISAGALWIGLSTLLWRQLEVDDQVAKIVTDIEACMNASGGCRGQGK